MNNNYYPPQNNQSYPNNGPYPGQPGNNPYTQYPPNPYPPNSGNNSRGNQPAGQPGGNFGNMNSPQPNQDPGKKSTEKKPKK